MWRLAIETPAVYSLNHAVLFRRFSPAIPYLAVVVGLYFWHNAWLTIVLYHLGMLAVLGWGKGFGVARELLCGYHHRWLLLVMVALSLVGGIFTYFTWSVFGLPDLAGRLENLGLPAGSLTWFLLYFTLVTPLLEELFWRGYHGNSSSRLLWHDLWFAGYHLLVMAFFVHWYWLPMVLSGLLFIAWLWRISRYRLGGLGVQFLSHIAADASVAVAVLLLQR